MKYQLILTTYDGKRGAVDIAPEIVEHLYLALHYTIAGDEAYTLIDDVGNMYNIDASLHVDEAIERSFSPFPDDITVIFPEDMKWETPHEA